MYCQGIGRRPRLHAPNQFSASTQHSNFDTDDLIATAAQNERLLSIGRKRRVPKDAEDLRPTYLKWQPVIVQKFPEQTACFSRLAPLFPDNVHFSLTMSTFPRQCPLFPDNVHYSPTCSTFSRQNGCIFAYTFLSPLRSQPSETFHFPFRDPTPPHPPLTSGAPPRSASPAARPRILPARSRPELK
jgi:hypothetical protein